jgi:cytochrome c biogenesis protein CcmG, thiol:disulfide interchange protein DsbE
VTATAGPPSLPPQRTVGRIILVALPLLLFIGLVVAFTFRLGNDDPSRLPSALIGHPAPSTVLPPLDGLNADGAAVPGLSAETLRGHVSVVNVWASWCVPCHDEAPLLRDLHADKRFQIVSINYKDVPENARRFLVRHGNPFDAVGVDANGRAAIEWGVYGLPETFVVGRDGKIAFKLVGPITPDNIDGVLKRKIEKALNAGS